MSQNKSTAPKQRSNNDHHADQMNPNSKPYKDRMDNHSNQLNPNNDKFQPKGKSK